MIADLVSLDAARERAYAGLGAAARYHRADRFIAEGGNGPYPDME